MFSSESHRGYQEVHKSSKGGGVLSHGEKDETRPTDQKPMPKFSSEHSATRLYPDRNGTVISGKALRDTNMEMPGGYLSAALPINITSGLAKGFQGEEKDANEGGRDQGGRKHESSLKRPARQISSTQVGDSQSEDDPPKKPNKRQRDNKKESNKASPQLVNRRPFACPYFRKIAIEHPECAKWNALKLSLVKEHCKTHHLKHMLCGRCKKFWAGSHEEITRHLEVENCDKSDTLTSETKGGDLEKKVEDVRKAKTWERLYEVLFPLYIPSPFWEDPSEVSTDSIDSLLPHTQIPEGHLPEGYRDGLAEFLKSNLPLEKESMDTVLNDYYMTLFFRGQEPLSRHSGVDYEDSGIDHTDNGNINRNSLEASLTQQLSNTQGLSADCQFLLQSDTSSGSGHYYNGNHES